MKQSKKRGFTIVELVIVIAVIAILAAVLIPTFASLINKAKLSADQQVVKNMNIVLQTEEADGKIPTELDDVFTLLEANGFKAPTSPSSKDYEYFWIKKDNRIVLVEMDEGKLKAVVYPEDLAKTYKELSDTTEWYCLKNSLTGEEMVNAAEGKIFHVGNNYYAEITDPACAERKMNGLDPVYNLKIENDGVFKILKDTNFNYQLSLDKDVEKATLDLCGNTILFNNSNTGIHMEGSSTEVKGALTIQNGCVQGMGGGSNGCAIVSRYGAFVLKNMTVECLATSEPKYAIYCYDCKEKINYIYDSTIKGNVHCGSGSSLNIYNTVIDGNLDKAGGDPEYVLYLENVTVTGDLTSSTTQQGIVIKSGRFKSLPEDKYTLAEGSELLPEQDAEGYYVIVEAKSEKN